MSHPHPPNVPEIRAEALWAGYNGAPALEELSFAIDPGHRVAIVGPNGAGKTTLFRVIAGVLRPRAGTIEIHGHPAGQHICVGYVPEHSQVNLDFPVSVRDVVMMGRVRDIGWLRQPQRSDWERVEQALQSVGLAEMQHAHFGGLSAGQRQRVFLAQAAAQGAAIVLLDEPLTGLDVPAQESLMVILDQLRSESITVLVGTHDLNFASSQFDRVMLLNRRLISYGVPGEALTEQALRQAYGGQLHVLNRGRSVTLLTDTHHAGH